VILGSWTGQLPAGHVRVEVIPSVDGRHGDPDPSPDGEQPHRFQDPYGFPDDGAGDAQTGSGLIGADAGSDGDRAGHDIGSPTLDDAVVKHVLIPSAGLTGSRISATDVV
jgi:hypothetical protein